MTDKGAPEFVNIQFINPSKILPLAGETNSNFLRTRDREGGSTALSLVFPQNNVKLFEIGRAHV